MYATRRQPQHAAMATRERGRDAVSRKTLLVQRPNGQPALASGAEDWCPCPVAAQPAGGVGTTREYMNITTTAIVLYDNTSPPVPESTGEAGGFGHLPVTLSLQVEIQAEHRRAPRRLRRRPPFRRSGVRGQPVEGDGRASRELRPESYREAPRHADSHLCRHRFARTGWNLASGSADGADTAVGGGAPAGQRTLYLPWPGYNGHAGPASGPSTSRGRAITGMRGRTAVRFPGPRSLGCMEIAARLHPAWHRCSPAARKLHARNAAILLSSELDCPVDAVVAWTRVDARFRCHGRHRDGAAHRGGARDSRPEPRRDISPRILRATAGHPPVFPTLRLRPSSQSGAARRANARQGRGRRAPVPMLDAATGRGDCPMFDFDVEVHSGSDLLAQLGLDGRAIRTILDEPAPFDPRGDDGE